MAESFSHTIPNVLADRYASGAMREIWSAQGRIVLERELWIAVLKAQAELGIAVPAEAIAAYEANLHKIDLEDIRAREKVTRHDVKARIDSFCAMAGHEHIHKGMTSRDLTENVEQLQVYRSLELVREKTAAALLAMGKRAQQWRDVPLTARTHNVAAQLTTMGKRVAMFGDELLRAWECLGKHIDTYPVRGLKGAVGTRLDQQTLFGDGEKAADLESRVAGHLGLPQVWENVGQVYPRSLDYETLSVLFQLSSGPSSFAKTLRLMAGHGLAGEGFAKGQTGSSAMPHKMNSRSCERINGFQAILRGHLTMVSALAGDQWNEGDVSCSVVRRVALPDAFFALDGLLETFLTVLGQMEINETVVQREKDEYLPFLSTTTILMAAVKAGAGREEAHEAIKEHAVAALKAMRSGEKAENDLLQRLAEDARLPLDLPALEEILANAGKRTGAAPEQVDAFAQKLDKVRQACPKAESYQPGEIL